MNLQARLDARERNGNKRGLTNDRNEGKTAEVAAEKLRRVNSAAGLSFEKRLRNWNDVDSAGEKVCQLVQAVLEHQRRY